MHLRSDFKAVTAFGWLAMAAVLACSSLALNAQTEQTAAQPAPSAESQPAAVQTDSNTAGQDSDSILSVDDVLDIYVMDVPELSRQYRVGPAGTVQVPLLPHPLSAAGLKITEF